MPLTPPCLPADMTAGHRAAGADWWVNGYHLVHPHRHTASDAGRCVRAGQRPALQSWWRRRLTAPCQPSRPLPRLRMQETFGSTCHGAGRAMSRSHAVKTIDSKVGCAAAACEACSERGLPHRPSAPPPPPNAALPSAFPAPLPGAGCAQAAARPRHQREGGHTPPGGRGGAGELQGEAGVAAAAPSTAGARCVSSGSPCPGPDHLPSHFLPWPSGCGRCGRHLPCSGHLAQGGAAAPHRGDQGVIKGSSQAERLRAQQRLHAPAEIAGGYT